MSILTLQRSIAEAGRIRIGQQVPTSGGRTRPEKLGTFRLTSPDRLRIEQAAGLFGGEVTPWAAPAGSQWQVITTTASLDVIVPPQAMAFSQHFELWTAGGCSRRCDGDTEQLGQQACVCDPDNRECDIHTRLSLMIRDLPGLGLWRLDTQGWYAARELAGAVEVLALAAGRGVLLPARLLLEQRSVKRPGKDGRPQTLRFAVPRLDLGITPGELLLSGTVAGTPMAALADGAPPERRLTPVPQIEGPRPTIAEQSAPPAARPPRKNAAPEIPASGRRRGTPAKATGEDGYWQARTFAEAAERGLDNDAVREIAMTVLDVQPDAGFSMSVLSEEEWEQVHRLIPGFGSAPTVGPADEGEVVDVPEGATGAAAPGASSAGTAPLSQADFRAGITAAGLVTAQIVTAKTALFPEAERLTDAMRGAVLARAIADAAQAAQEE